MSIIMHLYEPPIWSNAMSDNEFYQERAYISDYTVEELEIMHRKVITQSSEKEDECPRGVIIIDILGE